MTLLRLHRPARLRCGASHSALAATFIALTLLCGSAGAGPGGDAQAQYRSELAACDSGASAQSLKTCRREAQAAHAQRMRGTLADRDADYQRNASLRCEALAGSERVACVARMQGQGTTSGSVAAGGVLRELVTRTPEPAASDKPPL